MRAYICHKRVTAAQIAGIHRASHERAESCVVYETPDSKLSRRGAINVPEIFFGRGVPAIGDYLVRYEDGYLSWSPKAVFEQGYVLANDHVPV